MTREQMIKTLEELQRNGEDPSFELIGEAAAILGVSLTSLIADLLRRHHYPMAPQRLH